MTNSRRRRRTNREVANPTAVLHNHGKQNLPPISSVFSRFLLPELHRQVILHLARDDLESYALASRAFNREANYVLWRAIRVSLLKQKPEGIETFAQALRRDPVRAANIRHITFTCIPESWSPTYRPLALYIFARHPTEEFWRLLEDALRLITRTNSIRLLLPDELFRRCRNDTLFPDRFTDVISNVFKASHIANLHAYIRSDRLFELCQSWPSLTTLHVEGLSWYSRDALVALPSSALPLLRHLKSDPSLMHYITPGRPIETWYHAGEDPCLKGTSEEQENMKRLTATIRSCETLQRVRVECEAYNDDDAVGFLPAFAHDTLRNLHLWISWELQPDIDNEEASDRLTPSTLMRGLPPGALALFPKLEVLQITLEHEHFAFVNRDPDGEDKHIVANALAAFLTSESPATLCQVEVDFYFHRYSHYYHFHRPTCSALRFLAARCDDHWDVEIAYTEGPLATTTLGSPRQVPSALINKGWDPFET